LAKQQEAAGIKPVKQKKKDQYHVVEEQDESNLFSLSQNLENIESEESSSIYENSLKSLASIFNPEYK